MRISKIWGENFLKLPNTKITMSIIRIGNVIESDHDWVATLEGMVKALRGGRT